MKNINSKHRAFTLIELLIVIAIIGILFIVLVSKVDFATDKAKATGVQTYFRSFQLAFDTVAREQAGFSELVDGNYDKLEVAINKNLDAKLHIDIDDSTGEITMLNGALDPWNVPYHGTYIAGTDGKDRGAIVMYSNGANLTFGSEATIAGGVVTISTASDNGKDDYAIVSCYSLVNGYGAIISQTHGFGNDNMVTNNSSNNPHEQTHICQNVCEECNNCTDAKCEDYVCVNKCQGHINFLGEATFSDGVTLSWDELKDESNGAKYGYKSTELQKEETIGNAFANCKSLTSITIPHGVKTIANTFSGCSNLEIVNLPDSMLIIGWRTFEYCYNLKSIVIPEGVTEINPFAFQECNSLTSVKLPGSITSLGWRIFLNCSGLTSVEFCNGITAVGEEMFKDCSSLEVVILPDSIVKLRNNCFRNCDSLKSIKLPNNLVEIAYYAFADCDSLTTIEIPNSVTDIGNSAFTSCDNLSSVILSNQISTILSSTFYECKNLKSINISENIKSIEYWAFARCVNLEQIVIPGDLTLIDFEVFAGCTSLKDVVIGSVTTIGSKVFDGCTSLETVVVQNGTVNLGSCAFQKCSSLQTLSIPEIRSVGQDVFKNANPLLFTQYEYGTYVCVNNNQYAILITMTDTTKSSYILHQNTQYIAYNAMNNCSNLSYLEIPKNVISISEGAFRSCGFVEVVIPDSVKYIDSFAFVFCRNLVVLYMGNKVSSIGMSAFQDCESLATVYYNGSQYEWDAIKINSGNQYLTDTNIIFN